MAKDIRDLDAQQLTPEEREEQRVQKENEQLAALVSNIRNNVTGGFNRIETALDQYEALKRRISLKDDFFNSSDIDAATLSNGMENLKRWYDAAAASSGEFAFYLETIEKITLASGRGVK